mgnify:FL=1
MLAQLSLFLFLLAAGFVSCATAGDADSLNEGKKSARVCGSCHGPKGIARVESYPSLAGQSAQYLAKQLRAFRDGSRIDPQMSVLAKSLSDDEIVNISAWYASLSSCK